MRIEKKNKGTGFFGNSINAKDETKIRVIKSKESTIVDTIETGDRKNILEVHIENLESYTST